MSEFNKVISPKAIRYSTSIGYVVVPANVDRESHILKCMRQGTLVVLTEHNELLIDVPCSVSCLQYINFPESVLELGSAVILSNVLPQNKPIITGVLAKNDEPPLNSALESRITKGDLVGRFYIGGQRGSITLKAEGLSPKINVSVKGVEEADLSIDVDNLIKIFSTLVETFIKEKVSVIVGEKSDESSLLHLDKQKCFIKANSINLGEDGQKAVLGEDLVEQLDKHKQRLDKLIQAIEQAPITPNDGGASFKQYLVSVIQSLDSEDYSNILSKTVTIK